VVTLVADLSGRIGQMSTPIWERLRYWARLLVRPTGPPPSPTRRNQIFDAVLALAIGVAAVRYALGDQDVPSLIVDGMQGPARPLGPVEPDQDGRTDAAIAGVMAAAALAFRRRYPLAVLWVVLGLTVAVASDEPRITFYAAIIATYSAAAYSQYRLPAMATIALMAAAVTAGSDSAIPVVPARYIPLLVLVPLVVAADGMRRWRVRVDESRMQMHELERMQAEALRRATEQERARIARELHDVVTHNVSVMVIQAGAARKVLATAPDKASDALIAVEAGGRAAMAELRQVIGLLGIDGDNTDPHDGADLTPQPGLDQLESLVARVRDAGLPVELTVLGRVRPLSPGVELAAYRVVQESLTNTMKHASGAAAMVTVEHRDDALRIEVVDTGGTPSESGRAGQGRGLIGLRERLAVYGGTLHAGPRLTGGYRVEAHIPVEVP
jgi:signal transduction histidine kinase